MFLVKELIREVKNNIRYSPRKGGYIGNDLTYNIKPPPMILIWITTLVLPKA